MSKNKPTQTIQPHQRPVAHSNQRQVLLAKRTEQEIHIRQSNMPDEETLEAYARLIPGGADRLMTLIEKQADHRMKLESLAVPAQIKQSSRGQFFGFILVILAFILSAIFLFKGNPLCGGVIATSTAVSMATIFGIGKFFSKTNLESKKPRNPKPIDQQPLNK